MASPTFRPKSDWGRRLCTEGETHGEARSALAVLRARGLKVDHEVEARIRACADPEQLLEWVERAATVERAEDIFV